MRRGLSFSPNEWTGSSRVKGIRADASSLELPSIVRQFQADDILWFEWDVRVTTNLTDDVTFNNGHVLYLTSVSKCDCNDLITHTGLALRAKEITPLFWKGLHAANVAQLS